MQDDATSSPARGKHQAKGCCLLASTLGLVCFLLILSGIVCIIALDSIALRGEDHTLWWRVERYKVACQFLWIDFKDWVSRSFSKSSPSGQETVPCPADTPESAPEPPPGP